MSGVDFFGRPSGTVDSSGSVTAVQLNNVLNSYLAKTGGTMTGVLDLGNNKITTLADPTVATDATSKNYTDTTFVKKDGSVFMTGALNMGSQQIINVGNPTTITDAVNKNYIDNYSFLNSMSALMSKFVNMGGILFKGATMNVTSTPTTITLTQDTSVFNNPSTNAVSLTSNAFSPAYSYVNYNAYLILNMTLTARTTITLSVYNITTSTVVASITPTANAGTILWIPTLTFVSNAAQTYDLRISSNNNCTLNYLVGLVGYEYTGFPAHDFVTGAVDANLLTAQGIWFSPNRNRIGNGPTGVSNWVWSLSVFVSGSTIFQEYKSGNTVKQRYSTNGGTNWSSWT